MIKLVPLMTGAMILFTGCAARMEHAGNEQAIHVGATATKKVVLQLSGSSVATTASSWTSMKEAFNEACTSTAQADNILYNVIDDGKSVPPEDGTLLSVYVDDFRYIATGTRVGLGIMTGNAFIAGTTTFKDLKNGDVWGERKYNTSSTAWQGVFSAMTSKQAEAICKDMFDVVKGKSNAAH